MQPQAYTPTRRGIVLGTAGAVALGGAGLLVSTDRARAAVTLDIPDRTFAPDDGEAHAVWIVADGSYGWSNLDTDPAAYQIYLLVDAPGAPGDWSAISIADGGASAREESGSYQLRGDITASSAWSSEDFTANDDGSGHTVEVPVAVMLVVRDGAGDIIDTAEAMTTATVTIEHGGAVLSIEGAGSLELQDDSGDPTPTFSGGH